MLRWQIKLQVVVVGVGGRVHVFEQVEGLDLVLGDCFCASLSALAFDGNSDELMGTQANFLLLRRLIDEHDVHYIFAQMLVAYSRRRHTLLLWRRHTFLLWWRQV